MNAASPPPEPPGKATDPDTSVLLEFMFRLGQGVSRLRRADREGGVAPAPRRVGLWDAEIAGRGVPDSRLHLVARHHRRARDPGRMRAANAAPGPDGRRLRAGRGGSGGQGGSARGFGAARGDPAPEGPLRTSGSRRRPHHPHGRAGADLECRPRRTSSPPRCSGSSWDYSSSSTEDARCCRCRCR